MTEGVSDRDSMSQSPDHRDVAVRVNHLTKRYGDTVAVDDVSFEVRRGELFGVLGPNGAGKTTALECLEGLRAPDDGDLEIGGIDVGREPSRARMLLGVQLQASGLPATMRVGEAMRFFCAPRQPDPTQTSHIHRQTKHTLDPHGILNPGKAIPQRLVPTEQR